MVDRDLGIDINVTDNLSVSEDYVVAHHVGKNLK